MKPVLCAFFAAAAVLSPSIAAAAETAAPACAAPVVPEGELAPWTQPVPLRAALDGKNLSAATLAVGQAVTVTLHKTPDVRYAPAPEKPGAPDSHGGVFGFDVAEAGTYRVALGAGGWIDVVRQGKAVTSTAHGHGPACSGIRKIVDFPLTPGRYVLQLAGSAAPQTVLLVARKP